MRRTIITKALNPFPINHKELGNYVIITVDKNNIVYKELFSGSLDVLFKNQKLIKKIERIALNEYINKNNLSVIKVYDAHNETYRFELSKDFPEEFV